MLQAKIQILDTGTQIETSKEITSNDSYSSPEESRRDSEFQRHLDDTKQQQRDSERPQPNTEKKRQSGTSVNSRNENHSSEVNREGEYDDQEHCEKDVVAETDSAKTKESINGNGVANSDRDSALSQTKTSVKELLVNANLTEEQRQQLLQQLHQDLSALVDSGVEQINLNFSDIAQQLKNLSSSEKVELRKWLADLMTSSNNSATDGEKSSPLLDALEPNLDALTLQQNQHMSSEEGTEQIELKLDESGSNESADGKLQWLNTLTSILSDQKQTSQKALDSEQLANETDASQMDGAKITKSGESSMLKEQANVGLTLAQLKASQSSAVAESNHNENKTRGLSGETLQQALLNQESKEQQGFDNGQQAIDKNEQLMKAFAPGLIQLNAATENKGLATNSGAANVLAQVSGENSESAMNLADKLLNGNAENAVTRELGNLHGLGSVLNLVNDTQSENATKNSAIELQGVQLDKMLQAPKQESIGQLRQDQMIRENILFNKQELANNVQQQVGLMLARNLKSVDIRLDPPELGSMQIKLSVNSDQAAVSFVVSNQQTKDALEAAMPKLKEMLEEQGMQLADSDVKKDNSEQSSGEGEQESEMMHAGVNSADSEQEVSMEQGIKQVINSPWNVDYYA